jgi:hypothetical protein
MINQLGVSAAPCMNPQSNPAELGAKKKVRRLREFHFQWCKTYKVTDLPFPTVTSGCYRFDVLTSNISFIRVSKTEKCDVTASNGTHQSANGRRGHMT